MNKQIAAFLSKRPRLTESRQRFISELVIGDDKLISELDQTDRQTVIQFVKDRGVKDAVKEANIVQYLDLLADEKHISHEDQVAISKNKCDMEVPFAGLPGDLATKIVDQIEQFGHTRLINDATGQTDLTDTIKDDDLSAQPEPVDDDGDMGEATEIINLGDEVYEVTPDKRKALQFHEREMNMGWVKQSFHLAIILKSELYKVEGFRTQQEYAEMGLGESRRNMMRRSKAGYMLLEAFPDVTTLSHSDFDDYNEELEKIGEIGKSRFYELTKMGDAFDLKQLADQGSATLPSGEEITIDEIKAQTAREFADKLKEERQAAQKRISRLKEDYEKTKEERDSYKNKLDRNEELIDRATELEARHGEAAARLEERHESMDIVMRHISAAEEALAKVNLDDSDPDSIKERFQGMMKTINRMHRNAIDRNSWIRDVISETPIQPLKKDTA